MTDFNVGQLKGILKSVTHALFEKICRKERREDICGFSLYSDEGASSISAAYNTAKHLKKVLAEDPGGDGVYYRWYPAEWKAEGIPNKHLDGLSRMMFDLSVSDMMKKKGALKIYKNAIYTTAVAVLKELKREGLFDSLHQDFVLVFSVSDHNDKAKEIEWAQALNGKKIAGDFVAWRKTW